MSLQLSCRPFSLASFASRRFVASAFMLAAVGVAACFAPTDAAFAQIAKSTTDGTPQIDSSIANKDWNAALTQLDARLQSNPRDVQAKFKRATVLARLNRDDDAIAAFTELTQAYPELPEPYNNLAALYAKKGRYEDARVALETAVKANPGYALAYDNLGDLYLRLAGESYKRAQSLGSTSPLTRQRATDIQKIITPPPVSKRAASAASGATVASPPRAASDLWAPAKNDSTVPSPDSFAPFGGPSVPLQSTPYTAPSSSGSSSGSSGASGMQP
jgi:Tfp pilus assembly protein PilF